VIFVLSFVMLSELTKAWLLYLGIFFLLMVMYAPGGIASVIMMNLRVAKFGKFGRLWLPYLFVLVAAIPLFVGVVSLIEMLYHLQLESAGGSEMRLFGQTVDTASLAAWGVAGLATLVGCGLMVVASRRLAAAWGSAQSEIQAELERSLA